MTHFHIRWIKKGVLDWEPHSTRSACEEAARQRAAAGETYSIEEFDGSCERCRVARAAAAKEVGEAGSR